jgi:hypothetical protein
MDCHELWLVEGITSNDLKASEESQRDVSPFQCFTHHEGLGQLKG